MRLSDHASARTALTDDQAAWAFRKWCCGYTLTEIAQALHVSNSTLSAEFKVRGWQKQKQPLIYER